MYVNEDKCKVKQNQYDLEQDQQDAFMQQRASNVVGRDDIIGEVMTSFKNEIFFYFLVIIRLFLWLKHMYMWLILKKFQTFLIASMYELKIFIRSKTTLAETPENLSYF